MKRIDVIRLIFVAIAGVVFTPAVCFCADVNNYDTSMAEIHLLEQSPNVRTIFPGRSFKGRSIPGLIITDFSSGLENKARILITSGQHGDEYAPVKSVLSLSQNIAAGKYNNLLNKCVFVIIPIVNPDGLSVSQRLNAQNLDINRDWLTLQTAEAKYVDNIIRTWKPTVMIDVHQWVYSSPVPGDEIESPECVRSAQAPEVLQLAKIVSQNANLNLLKCSSYSNKNLFHRRYAMLGYAAYLLETAPNTEYSKRYSLYSSAILTAANTIISNPQQYQGLSPASVGFSQSKALKMVKYSYCKPGSKPSEMPILCIILIGYLILIWTIKTAEHKDSKKWSHNFRKCSVEPEIITDIMKMRHMPQPILYKSWTNRRLRNRTIIVSEPDSENDSNNEINNAIDAELEANNNIYGQFVFNTPQDVGKTLIKSVIK